MMSVRPASQIAIWIAAQFPDSLFTTTISQAEVLAGVAILPEGRRRRDLQAAARAVFDEDFANRVLPFDGRAAEAYAVILAARRRAGRPAATLDLMIAAVAHSRGASVVTRDTGGFAGFGVAIVDPWAAA